MNRRSIIRKLSIAALEVFAVWLATSFILYLASGRIIYKTKLSKGTNISIPFNIEYVENSNGDQIEMMWISKNGDDRDRYKTYLYLHGNAGRLPFIVEGLSKAGNVLSPSYPGYSSSKGRSNTDNINEVVDLSMSFLKEKNIADKNIIIFGHSLGGSPAVYASGKYPYLDEVILVNTFYSMKRMCEITYRVFCIFADNIHNTARMAPYARARIRMFHNVNDELISRSQGESLFKLLGSEHKMLFDLAGSHASFLIDDILKRGWNSERRIQ